jgi:mannosylglycoprotein endo-beta-mannosidase
MIEIKAQLLMARELVLRLDIAQEWRQFSTEESGMRKRMKLRCLGLSSLERTMARQSARIRHLFDGDTNTTYFHLVARGRKRKNLIPALLVAGHIWADHDSMEEALHQHFSGVFGTAMAGGITLDFQVLGIQALNLEDQDAPIPTDEVWAAIKGMSSDRALGPDGFIGAFYKTALPIIKQEFMDAIQAFIDGNTQNMGKLNSALVALLPKKVGANTLADFRPITMIYSFTKLISKILALRLAPRLDEMVDRN